jgi:hypothetical protein
MWLPTHLMARRRCFDWVAARRRPASSPPVLKPQGLLVRLQVGAELAVVVEVEPRGVGQAERGGAASVRPILALADPLHRDVLGAEADQHRAETLREVIDELAVGGQVENLVAENPVVADLRADQRPRAFHGRRACHQRIEAADLLEGVGRGTHIFQRHLGYDAALLDAPEIVELGQSAPSIRAP